MRSGTEGNERVKHVRLFWMFIILCLFLRDARSAEEKRRIVTLAPNLTETVFALGHGDDVVGVTDFCVFPKEAKSRRSVGGLFDANTEVLLSLKPDVVFLTPAHRKISEALQNTSIQVVVTETETIDDIYKTTRTVGEALHDKPAAEKLIGKMKSDVSLIAGGTVTGKRATVLFVIGYSSDGMREIYGVGPNTFLDELVTMAGGRNLLRDSAVRYPVVGREFLIANPPDVIIDANGGGDGEKVRSESEKALIRGKWAALFGEKAKRQPRIEFIDDAHITIPGPAFAESAEKIRRLIASP
ncbi:ABC transporter substrate-binding protein [Candidatus Sumerlaeota bacterium]|nr:ABC transporter substrate-binding protein [Candidatus Sumerlaeota bacterium]